MGLKLRNLVTVDTSKETSVTNNGYDAFPVNREGLRAHRDYYIRATVKYTDANFYRINSCY